MSHNRKCPVWTSKKPYDDGTATSFQLLTTILAQRVQQQEQQTQGDGQLKQQSVAPQPAPCTTDGTATTNTIREPSIPDVSFKGNPRGSLGQRREDVLPSMTGTPSTDTIGGGELGPSPLSDDVSLAATSPNGPEGCATLSSSDFQRTDTFASPSPEKKQRPVGHQAQRKAGDVGGTSSSPRGGTVVLVEPIPPTDSDGASFKTQWLPSALLAVDNSSSSRYAVDDDDDELGAGDANGWLGGGATTTRRSETAMGDTTFFCDGPTAIASDAGGRSRFGGNMTTMGDEPEHLTCLSPPAGVDATYTALCDGDQPNRLQRNAATETINRYLPLRSAADGGNNNNLNCPKSDVASVVSRLPQVEHIEAQIRQQMEKVATRDAAIRFHQPQPSTMVGRGSDKGPGAADPALFGADARNELAHYLFSLKQQVVMLSQLVAAQHDGRAAAGGPPPHAAGGSASLAFATTNSSAEFGSLRAKRRSNHAAGNPVTVHVVRDYDLPVVPYAKRPLPPPPPLASKLSKTMNSTFGVASSGQYSSDFTASGDYNLQGFGKSRTSSIPEDSIATALSSTWDR